jgi:HEPN domain-containing protein
LKTAHYLSKGRFWKATCYHSQQAAEKCLKARLLGKGWELEKVHSIMRLAALLEDFNIKIQISDDEVEYLDSIYRGRHPGEAGLLPLGEPSREDAMKALDIAEKLLGNT